MCLTGLAHKFVDRINLTCELRRPIHIAPQFSIQIRAGHELHESAHNNNL